MGLIARSFILSLCLSCPAMSAEKCSVEQATGQVEGDIIKRQGRSAQTLNKMIDDLKRVTSKAKDPHKAVGDQLSPRDAAHFAQLTTQMLAIRFSQFIESARERDATAVATMFADAWSFYGNANFLPEQEDAAGAVLFVMRVVFPNLTYSAPPPSAVCSVESALADQEREAVQRVIKFNPIFDRDTPEINRFKAKYNVPQGGSLDAAKMNPEDARAMQRMFAEMQPAFQEHQLAADIDNIRAFWSAAELIYQSRKEDIETYGAEADSIGKTLEARRASLDERAQLMLGIWTKLDEHMPSGEVKMMKLMSDMSKLNRTQ